MKNRVVALVPMRHYSERVPGKNYRPFNGKPLYQYIVNNLLQSPLVAEVVIDTDSKSMSTEIADIFPQVKVIERPEHLRDPSTPMNDVLLYDVDQVNADFYFQTHSTNPLLRSTTITDAIKIFLDQYPVYDSLFGVTKWQTRLWDELGRAINHNRAILLRTQDLPPIYEENSCLYLFTKEVLMTHHNRIGERAYLYEIDRLEATDIDEELDFRIAELLHRECYGPTVEDGLYEI